MTRKMAKAARLQRKFYRLCYKQDQIMEKMVDLGLTEQEQEFIQENVLP